MKKRVNLLLILLLVSSILVASFGAYLKYSLFTKLGIETEENIISLPFVVMTDRMLSYTIETKLEQLENPPQQLQANGGNTTQESLPDSTPMNDNAVSNDPAVTEPAATEPVYIPVEESWFDDVLFIGESRTSGLRDAGRLGEADYFCSPSLRVYDVMYARASDEGFYNRTLERILSWNTYGKVYIHFGINECNGDLDLFLAKYRELIDLIHSYYPDAYIMIMAIMPVSRDYADKDYFQPENLARFNAGLESLCDNETIFFVDGSEWYSDEEGYLREDLTRDGCHLYAPYYVDWAAWILEDAGWYGIP